MDGVGVFYGFKVLLLCLMVGCSGGVKNINGTAKLYSQSVEVPIALIGNVPVLVKKKDEVTPHVSGFAIDTGADISVLSGDYVRRYSLSTHSLSNEAVVEDAQGRLLTTGQLASIETLTFGGLEVSNFGALIMPLDDVQQHFWKYLEGILSASIFDDVVLTIDYPNSRIIFERTVSDHDGRTTLPLKYDNRGLPMLLINIGGQEWWAIIDTGASGALYVPEDITEKIDLTVKDAKVSETISLGGLARPLHLAVLNDELRIGNHIFRKRDVIVTKQGQLRIGGGLLVNFAVTFDHANETLLLAESVPDS